MSHAIVPYSIRFTHTYLRPKCSFASVLQASKGSSSHRAPPALYPQSFPLDTEPRRSNKPNPGCWRHHVETVVHRVTTIGRDPTPRPSLESVFTVVAVCSLAPDPPEGVSIGKVKGKGRGRYWILTWCIGSSRSRSGLEQQTRRGCGCLEAEDGRKQHRVSEVYSLIIGSHFPL